MTVFLVMASDQACGLPEVLILLSDNYILLILARVLGPIWDDPQLGTC